jgi:hypothetical protein
MQHGPVADTIARGGIGSVEHRLQLLPQKIGDQPPIRFLERDRQDAADLLQGCRLPVFEEAEEGLYGCQPDIARLRRVLARILEMLQEGADRPASICSSISADRETFNLFAANIKSSWKLRA